MRQIFDESFPDCTHKHTGFFSGILQEARPKSYVSRELSIQIKDGKCERIVMALTPSQPLKYYEQGTE